MSGQEFGGLGGRRRASSDNGDRVEASETLIAGRSPPFAAWCPLEDGARVELEAEHGRLYTIVGFPAPPVGDTVRLRLVEGALFPNPQDHTT